MTELIALMREKKLTVPKLHSKLLISGLQVSRNTLKSWVYKKRNPRPHTLAKIIATINDRSIASEASDEHQLVELRCKRDSSLSLVVKGLDRSLVPGEKFWIRPLLRTDSRANSTFTSDRLRVNGNMIFRSRCDNVSLFDRIFAFCGDDAIIMKVAVERSSS